MRRNRLSTQILTLLPIVLAARFVSAQAFLADDIVIISKGIQNKNQQNTQTRLGPIPGVPGGGPFVSSPGAPSSPSIASPTGVLSAAANQPTLPTPATSSAARIAPPPLLPAQNAPRFGPLEVPNLLDTGPPDGLTFDQAIDRLVHASLSLQTRFQEIPLAQADILTAGLRANPLIFFSADSVPYGNYTPTKQGSTGYGITWVQPLDVNGKRRARLDVANRARQVIEAQYQNAVRLEIDNLATAYLDVLNARETVRSIRASLSTLDAVLHSLQVQLQKGNIPQSNVDDALVQRDSAEVALTQAESVYRQTQQTLATLLALPPDEVDSLQLRGTLQDEAPQPPPPDDLIRLALCTRPDLAAYRLGVGRAQADVRLAQANRFEDVFLLYTPYGFQSNNFDRKIRGSTGWSLGVLASLPLVNRNQGNIARAAGKRPANPDRTHRSRTPGHRRSPACLHRVRRLALRRSPLRNQHPPPRQHSRDDKLRLFTQGQENIITYLTAQRTYQDIVRQYLDVLIQHRRSMLRLNTAIGLRLLP